MHNGSAGMWTPALRHTCLSGSQLPASGLPRMRQTVLSQRMGLRLLKPRSAIRHSSNILICPSGVASLLAASGSYDGMSPSRVAPHSNIGWSLFNPYTKLTVGASLKSNSSCNTSKPRCTSELHFWTGTGFLVGRRLVALMIAMTTTRMQAKASKIGLLLEMTANNVSSQNVSSGRFSGISWPLVVRCVWCWMMLNTSCPMKRQRPKQHPGPPQVPCSFGLEPFCVENNRSYTMRLDAKNVTQKM
mmetsp:Transcript_67043/g.193713  ORF Transcript_67043/g.193713 Transcript_67043/m.193713 type:complete len:245 (+) Transcript_67043:2051-2785(+)